MKNLEIAQGKLEDKFNIMEFAPKEVVKLDLDKKKTMKRRKLAADTTVDEAVFRKEMEEQLQLQQVDTMTEGEKEKLQEIEQMKKLRKLEEKLVFQDIQTQIHKKKTK